MKRSHPCPEIERLAALAEGRVSAAERATLLEHVATCDDCYEILTDTLKFISSTEAARDSEVEEGSASPALPRPWRRYAGLAIAAAVVLGLLIPLSIRWLRQGEALIAPGRFAQDLGADRQPEGLISALLETLNSGRGFAQPTDPKRLALRLGVRWINLEVARSAGDGVWRDRILRELERTVEGVPRFERQLAAVREARRSDSLSPAHLASLAETLGAIQPEYFMLGVWAESGRLSADTRRASFFSAPTYSEGRSLAGRLTLPDPALQELARIDVLAASGPSDEDQWSALQQSFFDLIQLLV